MPTPRNKETEDKFVGRCIPIVIAEGTAKDGAQAAAICHSMYQRHKKNATLRYIRRFLKGIKENVFKSLRGEK
jgi:hypothetical protein